MNSLAQSARITKTDPVQDLALPAELALGFGARFDDLYRRDGLARLDAAFVAFLREADAALHDQLLAARAAPDAVACKDESELIIALAPHLEDFIDELFGIRSELHALKARHDTLSPLYSVKRLFVQRRAMKKYGLQVAPSFDGDALRREVEALIGGELTELRFAEWVAARLDKES